MFRKISEGDYDEFMRGRERKMSRGYLDTRKMARATSQHQS